MKQELKKRILCRLPYIAENTSDVVVLFTHLISMGVLSIRERDNLSSHPGRYEKCVDLCSTIIAKEDSAYSWFLRALILSRNAHVAAHIQEQLTDQQMKLSIDECLASLDLVVKNSMAERKLYFFRTLDKLNALVFQHIGRPAREGMTFRKVFHSYYVLNPLDGERLFQLNWAIQTEYGSANVGMRTCRTLAGEKIMELNLPMTQKSIYVGNEYMGSVKMMPGSWYVLNEFIVLNVINELAYVVNLKEGSPTSPKAKWYVYVHSSITEKKKVASFGYHFPGRHFSEHLGLIFEEGLSLTTWQKALIFGAAVIIMDRSRRGTILCMTCKLIGRFLLRMLLWLTLPALIFIITYFGFFKNQEYSTDVTSNYTA